jgi:hypothetical protein
VLAPARHLGAAEGDAHAHALRHREHPPCGANEAR